MARKKNTMALDCATIMHRLSNGLLKEPHEVPARSLIQTCQSAAMMYSSDGRRFYILRKRNFSLQLYTGAYNATVQISKTARGVDAPQHLEYDAKCFLKDTGLMPEEWETAIGS